MSTEKETKTDPAASSAVETIVMPPMLTLGRLRIGIGAGSVEDDPEKLVTPGIVYTNESKDGFSAHVLAIGWWHFCIYMYIGIVPKNNVA